MIPNKKEFTGGLVMMAGFWVVFALLLSPLYPGQDKKVNMLDYMDSLYNSISKKSAYYIPEIVKKADKLKGSSFSVTLKVEDKSSAPESPPCSAPPAPRWLKRQANSRSAAIWAWC